MSTTTRIWPRTLIVRFLHDESNKPQAWAPAGITSRTNHTTLNATRKVIADRVSKAKCRTNGYCDS